MCVRREWCRICDKINEWIIMITLFLTILQSIVLIVSTVLIELRCPRQVRSTYIITYVLNIVYRHSTVTNIILMIIISYDLFIWSTYSKLIARKECLKRHVYIYMSWSIADVKLLNIVIVKLKYVCLGRILFFVSFESGN